MHLTKTDTEDSALAAAIDLWGIPAQVGMVIEECGELLTALNRYDRGRATAHEVAEEVADVMILMGQMSKVFGEDLVQEIMDAKVQRLIERVAAGYSLRSAQHEHVTNQPGSVYGRVCIYPDCHCFFDAQADTTWCAKGLPHIK